METQWTRLLLISGGKEMGKTLSSGWPVWLLVWRSWAVWVQTPERNPGHPSALLKQQRQTLRISLGWHSKEQKKKRGEEKMSAFLVIYGYIHSACFCSRLNAGSWNASPVSSMAGCWAQIKSGPAACRKSSLLGLCAPSRTENVALRCRGWTVKAELQRDGRRTQTSATGSTYSHQTGP